MRAEAMLRRYRAVLAIDWNIWKRPFGSYVFLWMALGLLSLTILLIAGTLTARERDYWVNHSLEVLQYLERYEAGIRTAQVRVDLWTGQTDDRTVIETEIANAQDAIDKVLSLVEDNTKQIIRVRMLKSLTDQFAGAVHARLQAPPLIGLPLRSMVSDLPLTGTINEIRQAERLLLKHRQDARTSADNSFWMLTSIAISSNLIIIWWAYAASRRYVSERNRTESEIRDLNARLASQVMAIRDLNSSLEGRVAEKTGELASTVSKLQATNEELERFAYVASHDMQEPLRQVASFNKLLALKYSGQLDSTANRYLDYSVAGAKRLQLMLRGLLQYTVTTPAAVNRNEVPVSLLMDYVLRELHPDIQEAGADIKVEAAEGLAIFGDRDMLRTLATALIQNAVKFRQPEVDPVVRVRFERQPQQWSMTIADNGVGIDERFRARMFEMFARYHPIGEHPGAGVGLALSKKIVDCHQGKLAVEPNPSGQGTLFTVTVPILSGEHRSV
jgi:signal transduction histidine kinase